MTFITAMLSAPGTGYNVMRSAAQLKDTAQEHNIEAMLKVGLFLSDSYLRKGIVGKTLITKDLAQEFKPETGKPKKAIEMKSWPTHKVASSWDV